MKYFSYFCLFVLPTWAQVELGCPVFSTEESRIADTGRFFFAEDRIYAAGIYVIHAFDYNGVCQEEYNLEEGWRFANFTVIPSQGQLVASTTKRVISSGSIALDFRMVFFETGPQSFEANKKIGFDPRLAEPSRAYFRNVYALPSGDIFANVWEGYNTPGKPASLNGVRVLSLQKIRFIDQPGSRDQASGYLIDFVGKPLYRRIFEPHSRLSSNKQLLMTQSQSGERLYFLHPQETVVRVLDRDKSGVFKRINDLQLDLPSFQHVSITEESEKREGSHIEGFLSLAEDKFLVVYKPSSGGDAHMSLQDEQGRNVSAWASSLSGVYVGTNGNIAYYFKMDGDTSILEEVPFWE
jgi:hypothetical protein